MSVSPVAPPPPPPAAPLPPPRQFERLVDEQLRHAGRQVKMVDLISGLLTLLACTLVYLLLITMVDHWIVGLNAPLRFVALAVLLLGGGYYFVGRLGPLLLRRINPEFTARTVEEVQPSLKNSLINFVQLRGERGAIREAVLFAIERRAAEDISHISVETTIDRGKIVRLGYVLIGIFVVFALYKVASPKDPFRSIARVLAPWARIDRPTRVRIESVQPGNAEIFLEDHLQVTVHVRGLAEGETPVLLYSTTDEQVVDREIALNPQAGENALGGFVFTAEAPGGEIGARQDFTYRVRAGDAESEIYAVHTINAPTIRVDRVEYQYPKYTQLPPRMAEGGELSAVEGTVAVIHARANQTIASATLEFDAHVASNNLRASIQLDVSDRAATGRVRLALKNDRKTPSHRSYRLRFLASSGHRNEHPLLHQIDVTPDFSPEVEVLRPQKTETEVPLNSDQIIEVRGIDPDFGLREISLRLVSGGRELAVKQLHSSPQGRRGVVTARFVFRPQEYALRVGDQVVFWATATDNRENAQGSPAPNRAKTGNYRLKMVAADPAAANEERAGKGEQANPDAAESKNEPNSKNPSESGRQESGEKNPNGGNSEGDKSEESKNSDSDGGDSKTKQEESKQGKSSPPMEGEQGASETSESGASSSEQGEPQDAGGEQGGGEGQQGEANDSNASASQAGSDGKGGASSESGGQGEEKEGAQNQSGQSSEGSKGKGNGNASSSNSGSSQPNAGAHSKPNERLSPDGEQDGDVFEQLQQYLKDRQADSGDSSSGEQAGQAKGEPSEANDSSEQASHKNAERQGDDSGRASKNTQPEAGGEGRSEASPGKEQRGEGKPGSPNEASKKDESGEKDESKGGEKGSPQSAQGKKNDDGKGKPNDAVGRQGVEPSSKKAEGSSGAGEKKKSGEKSASGEQGSKNQQGAPETQEQTHGKEKSADGKSPGKENENDAQSPNTSKHESDSEGAADGDRSGDGGKGGGQGGRRPGNDGAGSNTPGKTGAGAAEEQGQGETSSHAGQDQKSKNPTGQSGSEQGAGSKQAAASGPQAGQGKPSPGLNDSAAAPGKSPTSGKGTGRPGESGGAPGNQTSSDAAERREETPAERDKINLDYARRATDLALELLEDQKDEPDDEMLDRLGWTKDDLAKFLRRWRSMQRESRRDNAAGKAARQRLDDQLRGLGLRSNADVQRLSGRANDAFRDLSNEGYRSKPPTSYLEQYEAFKRGAARLQTP